MISWPWQCLDALMERSALPCGFTGFSDDSEPSFSPVFPDGNMIRFQDDLTFSNTKKGLRSAVQGIQGKLYFQGHACFHGLFPELNMAAVQGIAGITA